MPAFIDIPIFRWPAFSIPRRSITLHSLSLRKRPTRTPYNSLSSAPSSVSRGRPGEAQYRHIPVLLKPILDTFLSLACIKGSKLTIVDGTVGLGGHARAIIDAFERDGGKRLGRYLGIDKDSSAVEIARNTLLCGCHNGGDVKVDVLYGDFAELGNVLEQAGIGKIGSVDGVLLDIGVSSMQVDNAERGFSFLRDGPLDMRMDREGRSVTPGEEADGGVRLMTAADVVNSFSYTELTNVFVEGGETGRRAGEMAMRIVKARRSGGRVETTGRLADILSNGKRMNSRGVHPATLCFQALRIYVNGELTALKNVIPEAIRCLKPGGRLAIISFHSLEDRIVKRMFREAGDVRVLTKKPIMVEWDAVKRNPRSRSAKLRIVEKLAPGEEARISKRKYRPPRPGVDISAC